jgi:hypothetical protein
MHRERKIDRGAVGRQEKLRVIQNPKPKFIFTQAATHLPIF